MGKTKLLRDFLNRFFPFLALTFPIIFQKRHFYFFLPLTFVSKILLVTKSQGGHFFSDGLNLFRSCWVKLDQKAYQGSTLQYVSLSLSYVIETQYLFLCIALYGFAKFQHTISTYLTKGAIKPQSGSANSAGIKWLLWVLFWPTINNTSISSTVCNQLLMNKRQVFYLAQQWSVMTQFRKSTPRML